MSARDIARDLLILVTLKAEVAKREKALRESATDEFDPGQVQPGMIGGAKIGAVSYSDPKGSYRVTDALAWRAWVKENRPDEIVTETVESVRSSFESAMLDKGCDDDGVPFPGVAWVDPAPTLRVKPSTAASELIRAALAGGETYAGLLSPAEEAS